MSDMDFYDKLGLVYGQLLEQGEDPEEVLRKFEITEMEVGDEV